MTDEWGEVQHGGRLQRAREWLFGGPRRLGWWTAPLFVAVGLLGAVLAGSLAAVYYAQRVANLENQTAEARKELTGAVEEVSEVARDAVSAIESEVNDVRDSLAVTFPVEDPAAAGIVVVRAEVAVERPAAQPPQPQPGPSGESPQPPPSPPPPRTEVRFGSGFAVIESEGATFLVTAYAIVDDPLSDGVPVESAQVIVGGRSVAASVHSWDARRDLALLRVDGELPLEIAEWRPADEELAAGDRVFAVGLTPNGALTQVRATLAALDPEAVVTDTAVPDVVRGGPYLDAQGRVVAVASTAYRPFGAGASVNPGIPIRLLCEQLVRCGAEDLPAG